MKLIRPLTGALLLASLTLGVATTATASAAPKPNGLRIAPMHNIVASADQDGTPGRLGPGDLGYGTDAPFADVAYTLPAATDMGRPITPECGVTGETSPTFLNQIPAQAGVGITQMTCTVTDPADRPATKSVHFKIVVHNSLAVYDGPFDNGLSLLQNVAYLDPALTPLIGNVIADIATVNETQACTDMTTFQNAAQQVYGYTSPNASATWYGTPVSYLLSVQLGQVFGCFNPNLVP
jgi:hypothetical protein